MGIPKNKTYIFRITKKNMKLLNTFIAIALASDDRNKDPDELNNRMTPFERLQWIDDARTGAGRDDFDGMASLVGAQLESNGGKARLGEWYDKKLGSISGRMLARLTKIVNQQVNHPSQYFDDDGLAELFPSDPARGFDRSDACHFAKQIRTSYFTFANRFTSHNKRTSLKETSSFGNTMKKGLNKIHSRIHAKMGCA